MRKAQGCVQTKMLASRMKIFFTACLLYLSQVTFADELDLTCFVQGVNALATSHEIQSQLLEYNRKKPNPLALEKQWPSLSSDSSLLRPIIENPAAQAINSYIRRFSMDGEGFLIGVNGGVAAATQKTSDYYQADEAQFFETIDLPEGEAWIKKGVVDQSASAMLIKIAVPVYDQRAERRQLKGPAVGVLVIGLYEFVVELSNECEEFTLPH